MIHTDVFKKCPNLVTFYDFKYSRKLCLSERKKKPTTKNSIKGLDYLGFFHQNFHKINKVGLKNGTFWQSLQRPSPLVHWCGRKKAGSASPPGSLLTILHLPLSWGEIKTLFIQFIWQPELMTVPEIVQNFLTSKPSKPASLNYKQGTGCPFIHQEPHTGCVFLTCHSEKRQILLFYYKTDFRHFTLSVELENELRAELYLHLMLSLP